MLPPHKLAGLQVRSAKRLVLRAVGLVFVLGAVLLCAALAQAQVPQQAARYRLDLVRQAQAQWGLQAPVAALAAQVHQESGWRPGAVSHVGAQGMAQFMPATARWWCARAGDAAADCQPLNPRWALRAMVGYDKFLYDRTPARLARYDRLWLALRGYNGGEGHWQAEGRSTGLAAPTRVQIDAACGAARRHRTHCAENLGYPRRILLVLQPRYRTWGAAWEPAP